MLKFTVKLTYPSNDKERAILEKQGLLYKHEHYIHDVYKIETQGSVVLFISLLEGKSIVTAVNRDDFKITIEKEG